MGGTASKDVSENIKSIRSPEPVISPASNATLPRERLPAELQKIVDEDDTLFEQIFDGKWVHPYQIAILYFF